MPIFKKVNKDFFKTWSHEMAYVLGFFAADGSLVKNKRGACFFSLEIGDLDIVLKIRSIMGSDHKIGIRTSKNSESCRYRLQIGSKEIYNDLKGLGFEKYKTFNMCVPKVPNPYFGDFVRGYFDGDGNIWAGIVNKTRKNPNRTLSLSFTSSSKGFLKELLYRLKIVGIIGGSLVNFDTFYRLSFSFLDALRIYDLMYNREHLDLYLERKKSVFDRL